MAGTDRTKEAKLGGPTVVLVAPQLGENIGAVARAMLNFGLTDLRLVAPRDGWPNERAIAAASGARVVLDRALLYSSAAAAVADIQHLYATTARARDIIKPVMTPRHAAGAIRAQYAAGKRIGILFGPERTGLENEDAVLAQAFVTVPINPAFASLNIAQAVLLIGYEWFLAGDGRPSVVLESERTAPATQDDLGHLFRHLEDELDAAGFLKPPEKRASMVQNLRAILTRANLMEQEVRTLRGVIKALVVGRRGRAKAGPV
jgi:tRNA/rRNA methyltransferase